MCMLDNFKAILMSIILVLALTLSPSTDPNPSPCPTLVADLQQVILGDGSRNMLSEHFLFTPNDNPESNLDVIGSKYLAF